MATEPECAHRWLASPLPTAWYCGRCGTVRLFLRPPVGASPTARQGARRLVGLLVAVAGIGVLVVAALPRPAPPAGGVAGADASPTQGATRSATPGPLPSVGPPTPSPPRTPALPVVPPPVVSLAASDSYVPGLLQVNVSWRPTAKAVFEAFQVQLSVDDEPHRPVRMRATATGISQFMPVGHRFGYRVRGRTATGWTEWSIGPVYTIRFVQDGAGDLTYSGAWRPAAHRAYTDGQVTYTEQRGDRASIVLQASSIAWLGPRGPTRGAASVTIDGGPATTIDALASEFRPRSVLFVSDLEPTAEHRLIIRANGTAGRPMVALDAVALLVTE